jgi:hypothetical protein
MALASCLVDTNILLRVASRSGAEHPMVDKALAHLAEQGTILHYTLQNMAEFWNVMTRPTARNGFGFSLSEADREIRAIESGMVLSTGQRCGVCSLAEHHRSIWGFRSAGARCAFGGSHVCPRSNSHPHVECARIQPLW